MLRYLGMEDVRLMTNNPEKIAALEEHGICVVGRVPHMCFSELGTLISRSSISV
ncbi:hypothetical protein ACQPZ2_24495 [Nocardia pseudovaccinii]|uniref:hypothetical protein n=1 Tax=Nocardia pseudovaccinii TaxID=189540 RepID=UPI003D8C5901